MNPIKPFFISIRTSAIAFGLFLAVWSLGALFVPAYVIPSPLAVIRTAADYCTAEFRHHFFITLFRVGIGFLGAFALGSVLGIFIALVKKADAITTFLILFQVIPGTILGVIFLLVFGIGNWVPILLVGVLILPVISINTANSLLKRNLLLEQYLRSIGSKRSHLLQHSYLPVLVTTLQSNLTVGFGLSLKVVILGEFIGAQDGIGYLLNLSRIYFKMNQVFFYLLVILLIMGCFNLLQNLLFTVLLKHYFYAD